MHSFILQILEAAGHTAVLAGGCVRDALLGVEPKDFDVATSALPVDVAAVLALHGVKTIAVGQSYGVVIACQDGEQVEIATFRQDGEYSDGRRPDSVEFADIVADSSRRDFTVNAMYQDAAGQIHDFHGGKSDLENRILRTVGCPHARFAEDKLRMMRAVRFACKGFALAPELVEAVRANAAGILDVSSERIREELFKILASADPRRGLELLNETGLLEHILPEVHRTIGCEQDCIHHPEGDVFEHSLIVVDMLKGESPELVLAGLLHDIGKCDAMQIRFEDGIKRISNIGHAETGADLADAVCRRLRLDNDSRNRIVKLVAVHMRLHTIADMRQSKAVAFLRDLKSAGILDAAIKLQHADSMGNPAKSRRDVFFRLVSDLDSQISAPKLVSGKDLIALGMKPGPAFKQILDTMQDLQDAGMFADRQAALDHLASLVG